MPWRMLPSCLLLAGACAAPRSAPAPPPGGYSLVLLGAAQDGGLPQLACNEAVCEAARRNPRKRARVAALAVIAPSGRWWLIDATPDLPAQIHQIGSMPQGVFLTHAHMGHYAGLLHFGKEAAATRGMPVYCEVLFRSFLESQQPWKQLVTRGNIQVVPMLSEVIQPLEDRMTIRALAVPHRHEFTGTFAFEITVRGGRSALYLPDIDAWRLWDRDLREVAAAYDYLILDGTFWSPDELPGRDQGEVPHPPVLETIQLLEPVRESMRAQIVFTHLNHTNPLWDPRSSASRRLRTLGYSTARERRLLDLSPPATVRL